MTVSPVIVTSRRGSVGPTGPRLDVGPHQARSVQPQQNAVLVELLPPQAHDIGLGQGIQTRALPRRPRQFFCQDATSARILSSTVPAKNAVVADKTETDTAKHLSATGMSASAAGLAVGASPDLYSTEERLEAPSPIVERASICAHDRRSSDP